MREKMKSDLVILKSRVDRLERTVEVLMKLAKVERVGNTLVVPDPEFETRLRERFKRLFR